MNILALLWQDVRNWFRKPFLWVVAGGVAAIPLLYSVLYLWAFWDPYSLINHLPAAVVVEDQGALDGTNSKNVGQEFGNELRTNTAVDWQIVDKATAEKGLEDGTYFFTLYIPPDFTAKVLTASEATPQQATLTYKANPSTNFLATSVAKRVVLEVQTKLAEKVSGGYFTASLTGLQQAADGLHEAADGAGKLAAGTKDAHAGAQKAQDGAVQLYGGVTQLAAGTGTAKAGAGQVAAGAQSAKAGAEKLTAGAQAAKAGAGQVAGGAKDLSVGSAKLQQGTGALLQGATDLTNGLTALQAGLNDPAKGIPALTGGIAQVQGGTTQLQQGITGGIQQLQVGTQQSAQAVAGAKQVLEGMAQANPALATDPNFQKALALVSGAEGGLNGQVLPGMTQLSQQASAGFAQVQGGQAQVAAGVSQLKGQADGALAKLVAGGHQVTAGAGALQQGAGQVATGADRLAGGASALQGGLGDLSGGLGQLSSGLGDLTTGSDQLATGLDGIDGGANRLATGLGALASGSGDLTGGLSQLQDGSTTLASKLSDAAQEMAKAAQGNPEAKGEAMASPVALNEVNLHDVKQYGTGLAPYFVPLGLWVGAMVLFFVIRFRDPRAILSSVPAPLTALSKYLFFAGLATVQAVLASFVLLHFLGLQVQNVAQFYGMNVLLSLVFVAIFQLLVTAFGLVGRFLGIVILMLQLTSAGGTFPTQMLPGFFQALHPFMPMTYAVEGLRTVISGAAAVSLTDCVLRLVGFGLGALALALLLAPRFVTMKDLRPSRDLAM